MARFNVDAVFRAIDKFSAPILKMEKGMRRFTRMAERGLRRASKSADKFFRFMRKGARVMALVGAATAGAVAVVVRAGAEFEQSLTGAVAKFPEEIKKGSDAFNELKAVAMEVGGTTEFTAAQAAEGLNFLAMAGFNAEQAMSALPGVVNLATAAQVELGEASDFATDTLGAFGLMTKDTAQLGLNLARVSDVMAKTSTSANTSFGELFEAFKMAGPVATAAGGSIEEVSSMLAVLANAGFKGSQGGVAMRNAYLGVTAATGKAEGLVKKYVGSLKDGNGGIISMTEIVDRLSVSMADLSKEDRIKKLTQIFGKRAVGPFLTLLDAGAKGIQEFREQIDAAEGTSDKMANTMRDTVQGSLKGLTSAIDSVKIGLFDMQSGPLKDTIDGMATWVRTNKQLILDNVNGFIEFFKENGPLIVSTLTRLARVAGVFAVIATGIKLATAAMIVFNAALWANPIGAVIGALALLAFFWDEISGTWKEAKIIVKDLWDTMKNWLRDIIPRIDDILKPLEALGFLLTSPFAAVKEAFGFGGDDEQEPAPEIPTLADGSPAFQIGGGRTEFVTREEINLSINDPNNRTEVSRKSPRGSNLALGRSGG